MPASCVCVGVPYPQVLVPMRDDPMDVDYDMDYHSAFDIADSASSYGDDHGDLHVGTFDPEDTLDPDEYEMELVLENDDN